MPVIDSLIVRQGDKFLPIDSYDNKMIDEIVYEGESFHFAKQKDIEGETSINADNAVQEPLVSLKVSGNTTQQTYKGYNLFDIDNYTTIGTNKTLLFDISHLVIGTKYTITSNKPLSWVKISTSEGGVNSVQKADVTTGFTKFTFTMSKHSSIAETSTQYLLLGTLENYSTDSSSLGVIKDISSLDGYEIQIVKGTEEKPYEPYVGGTSSPNPQFPQPIQNAGDISPNLFDIANPSYVYLNATGKQYTMKITDGIISSGGVSGVTSGQFFKIDVSNKSNITISFDAEFNETTETRTVVDVRGINEIGTDDIAVDYKTLTPSEANAKIVNGANSFTVDVTNYNYLGIAFISITRYGIKITNLQVKSVNRNGIECVLRGANSLVSKDGYLFQNGINHIKYDLSTQIYEVNLIRAGTITTLCTFDTPIPTGTPYTLIAEAVNDDFENTTTGGNFILDVRTDNSRAGGVLQLSNLKNNNKKISATSVATKDVTNISIFRHYVDGQYAKNLKLKLAVIFGETDITEWQPYFHKTLSLPSSVTVDGQEVELRMGGLSSSTTNYRSHILVDRIKNKVFCYEYQKLATARTVNNRYRILASVVWFRIAGLGVPTFVNRSKRSSHFSSVDSVLSNKIGFTGGDLSSDIYFSLPLTMFSDPTNPTVTEANTWLQSEADKGTPVTFLTTYAEPIEYDLTETEIGQNLLALATEKGTNILEIKSEIPVSETELSYWRQIIPGEL